MTAAGLDTAVVMAGGKGMRLRPYTTVLPKPLMPIGSMPILEILLRQLRSAGIRRVILTVNHLAHLIQAVFGDGRSLDLQIIYQLEDEPLGTCGSLAGLLPHLPEQFLVVNGDLLTNYPIREILDRHLQTAADATIATVRRSVGVDFGVIARADDGRVQAYIEKPATVHEISIGLYVLARRVLEGRLIEGQFADMPTTLTSLLEAGHAVHAHPADCTWIDIGQPEQCQKAQELFETDPQVFLPG